MPQETPIDVDVEEWKLDYDDRGKIIEGLYNPVPKDVRTKIKFKAGPDKGWVRVKVTVINKENRRISGVLSIRVVEVPPITVTGCVKLFDENGKPLFSGGVKVSYQGIWSKNRQEHDRRDWMQVPRQLRELKTDRNGRFNFIVPTNNKFVSIICKLPYGPSSPPPPGYKWDNTPSDKGNFDYVDWKGIVKPGDTIPIVQSSYGCLSYFLKKVPITFYIGGKITHHDKPVEEAKVKLLDKNGNRVLETGSKYDGQYWLECWKPAKW